MRIVTSLMLVGALSTARADVVGKFYYSVPKDWSPCKVEPPFDVVLCGPNEAQIAIKSPMADAVNQLKTLKGEILADKDIQFAGKPGHVMVMKQTKGTETRIIAAGATDEAGGVVVVTLTKEATSKEALGAWGGVIDAGSFDPPPAADAPPVAFQVRNGESDCKATAFIDGNSVEVEAGKSVDLQLKPGPHKFEWQARDGSAKEARAVVPPATFLSAGCAPPAEAQTAAAAPPPAAPAAPPPVAPVAPDQTAEYEGARAAARFYGECWNLQRGEMKIPDKTIDLQALKIYAHRPVKNRKDFITYVDLEKDLAAAIENVKTADAADPRHEQLRKLAMVFLAMADQVPLFDACRNTDTSTPEGKTKMLGCLVDQTAGMSPVDANMLRTTRADLISTTVPPTGQVVDALHKLAAPAAAPAGGTP
jgi:hypothetical protein